MIRGKTCSKHNPDSGGCQAVTEIWNGIIAAIEVNYVSHLAFLFT